MSLLSKFVSTNPYAMAVSQLPWKYIAIGLAIIAIVICGSVAYTKYNNALNEVEVLKRDVKIEQIKVADKEKEITRLNVTLKDMEEYNNTYIYSLNRIQSEKNRIQIKYNDLMEKIRNAKLEIGKNGTITGPYTVIPGGVPVETRSTNNLP